MAGTTAQITLTTKSIKETHYMISYGTWYWMEYYAMLKKLKIFINPSKTNEQCNLLPITTISLDITSSWVYLHFNCGKPFRSQVNKPIWSTIVIVEDVEAGIVPPSSWGVTAMSPTSTRSKIQPVNCTKWLSNNIMVCSKYVSWSNTLKS